MNIIIFGFHRFPQFHRLRLSARVISKKLSTFPSPFLSPCPRLENHEDDVDHGPRTRGSLYDEKNEQAISRLDFCLPLLFFSLLETFFPSFLF